MATANETHDIVISDLAGSTEQGFMLLRDKGKPIMRINYAPTLSPQMFTSEASYANSPPSIEKVTAQEDWRRGMGEEKYDDPLRYAEAHGCDARFKGRVVLGPLEYAAGSSLAATAYTLVNPSLETAPGAAGFGWRKSSTAQTEVWARVSSPAPRAGTYCLHVSDDFDVSHGAKQTVPIASAFNGKTATFTAYLYHTRAAGGLTFEADIYQEGVSRANTALNVAGSATWTQISCSYAATSTTARVLEVRVRNSATTGDAGSWYLDSCALSFSAAVGDVSLGTPTCFEEYEGGYYAGSDTGLWQWSAGSTRWERVAGSPSDIVDLEASGDYLFIARGTAGKWFYYDSDAELYFLERVVSGDTTVQNEAHFFKVISSSLYKARLPNKVASAATPTTGSWSEVSVGETAYDITGLADHRGVCYAGKKNSLFTVVGSTVTEIAPELRTLFNAKSGKNLMDWKGYLFIPMGKQALYQYDGGSDSLGSVNPATYSPGLIAYSGQVLALEGDEEYLFAFVYGDTGKFELLAGRYETIGSSSPWVWHPIYQLAYSSWAASTAYAVNSYVKPTTWNEYIYQCTVAGTAGSSEPTWPTAAGSTVVDNSVTWTCRETVRHAKISSITSPPRLWFITGATVKYLILPDRYADITQATGYNYVASGTLITGYMDFGFVDQVKAYASLFMYSKGLAAGTTTVAASYEIDDAGSWTSLGTFNTSPQQTLYFPVNTTGRKIRFKFTLSTSSSTSTPELRAYALRGLVAWARKKQFSFVIKAEDNITLLNKAVEETRAHQLAGVLKYFSEQPYVTMKIYEETAVASPSEGESTYYIRILDLSEDWQLQEGDDRPTRVFNVSAVEVKLS